MHTNNLGNPKISLSGLSSHWSKNGRWSVSSVTGALSDSYPWQSIEDDLGIGAVFHVEKKKFANKLYSEYTISETGRRDHKRLVTQGSDDWKLIFLLSLFSDCLFGTCGSISTLSAVEIWTRYVCSPLFILMVNVILHVSSLH